jgi:hypothetical protein
VNYLKGVLLFLRMKPPCLIPPPFLTSGVSEENNRKSVSLRGGKSEKLFSDAFLLKRDV